MDIDEALGLPLRDRLCPFCGLRHCPTCGDCPVRYREWPSTGPCVQCRSEVARSGSAGAVAR